MHGRENTYQDEPDYCNDGHEDTPSPAKRHRIHLHERLRCPQCEEGVQIRSTEKKENGGDKTQNACGYSAVKNSLRRNDTE
jgi:hypothetical protein